MAALYPDSSFFFQAEDGIRDGHVTGVQSVLFRSVVFDTESHLEQRFRGVLAERLATAGATVKEKPGPDGNRWVIRHAGRRWTLDPQVDLHGSRPDFVLRSEQPGIPEVAIFTDGWRYHA